MKTAFFAIIIFLSLFTFNVQGGVIISKLTPPQSETMDLVDYKATILRVPFFMKYPGAWHVREERNGITAVFFTKERIFGAHDEFTAGVSVRIIPGYYKTEDIRQSQKEEWEEDARRLMLMHSVAAHNDEQEVLSLEEKTFLDRPTVVVEVKKKKVNVQTIMYHIKNKNDLMQIMFTAPTPEFETFRPVFLNMIGSFRFLDEDNESELAPIMDFVIRSYKKGEFSDKSPLMVFKGYFWTGLMYMQAWVRNLEWNIMVKMGLIGNSKSRP